MARSLKRDDEDVLIGVMGGVEGALAEGFGQVGVDGAGVDGGFLFYEERAV